MSIDVTGNPFGIPLDDLFSMAARINKKRSFLFVSKLLGKHIPVRPAVPLLAGAALALLYKQAVVDGQGEGLGTLHGHAAAVEAPDRPAAGDAGRQAMDELLGAFHDPQEASECYERIRRERLTVKEPTLFVGFAETATALGHSMFDRFAGEAAFLHTTRESLAYMASRIDFEEEHSHATAHRCYAADPALFEAAERIVLVDDELTTGRTSLNIIADLHDRYGKTRFAVASLLDWRSAADKELFREFEAEHGVTIECFSLVSGEITVTGSSVPDRGDANPEAGGDCAVSHLSLAGVLERLPAADGSVPYLLRTGRFGLSAGEQLRLEEELEGAIREVKARMTGERVLVMGNGEFMYIPMRIAAGMGGDVRYQSTTRSPIHPYSEGDYAVRSAYRYPSPDGDITNFIYNIPPGYYDELFFFVERLPEESRMEPLLAVLRQLGIGRIHIVDCSR